MGEEGDSMGERISSGDARSGSNVEYQSEQFTSGGSTTTP
jgi:hypothetical protein